MRLFHETFAIYYIVHAKMYLFFYFLHSSFVSALINVLNDLIQFTIDALHFRLIEYQMNEKKSAMDEAHRCTT